MAFNTRKNKSLCCSAPALTVGVRPRQWYVCKACKKPCDLVASKSQFNNQPVTVLVQEGDAANPRVRRRTYRSKLEYRYAEHLDFLKRIGEIQSWDYEPQRFILKVNGRKITTYTPDFLVVSKHGREEIHETKGRAQRDWKIKWELMQALFPEYYYEVIYDKDF